MRSYDLGKLSILVLEKHLLVRRLLTDVFSEFGVPTVHSTPDPEMAWDIFIQFQVDLILCDWAMAWTAWPSWPGSARTRKAPIPTCRSSFVPPIRNPSMSARRGTRA